MSGESTTSIASTRSTVATSCDYLLGHVIFFVVIFYGYMLCSVVAHGGGWRGGVEVRRRDVFGV